MKLKKLLLKGGNNNNNNIMIFIILLCLTILLVYIIRHFHYMHINNIEQIRQMQQIQQAQQIQQIKQENISDVPDAPDDIVTPEIYDVLRKYDYRTLGDPLTPPYKRDDYMIPAYIMDPNNFGIYTQGGPAPFMKMGYLNNRHAKPGNPYKFLTLMGRPRYYGSSRYDYYVISNSKDDNLKIDLDQYKYRNELYTGDKVYIPQLETEYDVNIDRILDYTYNPYIV